MLFPNLAGSHTVRVAPIAKALQRDHDVELIGVLARDAEIYPPLANAFVYHAVRWDAARGFGRALREVERAITGDLVYAFQPKLFSFGAALLHKLRTGRPVMLDITDWEVWKIYREGAGIRHGLAIARRLASRGWLSPDSSTYRYVLDKLIARADALTVVATFLQRRYGGVLLRHGPDTAVFDPARHDGPALRQRWGLPAEPRLILFAGPPRPWKGLDQILAALDQIPARDVRVLMAGKRAGAVPDRVIHVGLQPHAVMPELLAMADLVVLPQRPHPMAVAQVPNKGLEAMAMAKPIVASRVGDLPDVLEGCGVVVEPESTAELAAAIERLLAEPEAARAMGRRAREKCVREFSHDAIARVLAGVLRRFSPDALTPPGAADTRR